MDRITEEMLSSLQAQVAMQHLMLLALVKAHPDPARVLAMWQSALADAVDCKSAVPSTCRHSDLIRERCADFSEQWTALLVDEAVVRSSRR